jgi:hypothetical protein
MGAVVNLLRRVLSPVKSALPGAGGAGGLLALSLPVPDHDLGRD